MKNYFRITFVIITILLLFAFNAWSSNPNTNYVTYIVGALVYYAIGMTLSYLILIGLRPRIKYTPKLKIGNYYYVIPFERKGGIFVITANYDKPFDMYEAAYKGDSVTKPGFPLMRLNSGAKITPIEYIFDKRGIILLKLGLITPPKSVKS